MLRPVLTCPAYVSGKSRQQTDWRKSKQYFESRPTREYPLFTRLYSRGVRKDRVHDKPKRQCLHEPTYGFRRKGLSPNLILGSTISTRESPSANDLPKISGLIVRIDKDSRRLAVAGISDALTRAGDHPHRNCPETLVQTEFEEIRTFRNFSFKSVTAGMLRQDVHNVHDVQCWVSVLMSYSN